MNNQKKQYASYTITEEMFELGLSARELIIFAIIYSYSKGGKGAFFGKVKYLASAINSSEKTAYRALRRLFDLNLIQRCEYQGRAALKFNIGPLNPNKVFVNSEVFFSYSKGKKDLLSGKYLTEIKDDGGYYNYEEESEEFTPSVQTSDEEAAEYLLNKNFEILDYTEKEDPRATGNSKRSADAENGEKELKPKDKNESKTTDKTNCKLRDTCIGTACYFCIDGNCYDDSWLEEYEGFAVKPKKRLVRVAPKFELVEFGREGVVALTWDQYEELRKLVRDDELQAYILRLEKFILSLPDTSPFPHSHYRTLKKWITKDCSL